MFKRKLSPPKKKKMHRKYFPENKTVPVCSFWKESTTEVDLRQACTMVFDSNPASDLFAAHESCHLNLMPNLISKLTWEPNIT